MNLTKKLNKNVVLSFLFKIFSTLIALLSLPLFLEIFSPKEYGLWVTIFSMLTWISYFDFGLSQGLRNKLTEYFSTKNFKDANKSINFTYQITFLISLTFLIITIIISFLFGFEKVFNTSSSDIDINNLIILIISMYAIQFVLNNVNGIFHSLQNSKAIIFIQLLCSIFTFFFLSFSVYYEISSIKTIAFFILGFNLIVSFCATLYAFKKIKNSYGFSIYLNPLEKISLKIKNSLLNLSYKFFVIQFSGIFLFNSINYLVTLLYGSENVVPFSIACKIYLNLLFLFYVLAIPFWSAFTEAYFKKDFTWIIRSLKKLFFIYLGLVLVATLGFLLMDWIVELLVGNKVTIPHKISFAIYIYILIMGWNGIFAYFLNGLSLINTQFKIAIVHVFTNIPICILLAQYFDMGITGLIWGTNLSLLIFSIIIPLEAYKVIKTNLAQV